MSYMGEKFIKKLNEEEDERQLRLRLVSDCCMAEISVGRTKSSYTSPGEPYYVCLKCERKCDSLTLDESEDVNE